MLLHIISCCVDTVKLSGCSSDESTADPQGLHDWTQSLCHVCTCRWNTALTLSPPFQQHTLHHTGFASIPNTPKFYSGRLIFLDVEKPDEETLKHSLLHLQGHLWTVAGAGLLYAGKEETDLQSHNNEGNSLPFVKLGENSHTFRLTFV